MFWAYGWVWCHSRGLVRQRCRGRITWRRGGWLHILKGSGVIRRLRLRLSNRRGKENDENKTVLRIASNVFFFKFQIAAHLFTVHTRKHLGISHIKMTAESGRRVRPALPTQSRRENPSIREADFSRVAAWPKKRQVAWSRDTAQNEPLAGTFEALAGRLNSPGLPWR